MDIQTETMKRAFLGWQCRLRQIAVREEDGRPTPGMRPQFDFSEDGQFANAITVLIVRVDAFADASQFRHLVLRSQDPAERLASGLRFLSATHYHHPKEFSDEMTALFEMRGLRPRALLARGACVLRFEEFSTSYTLPCRIRQVSEDEPAFQATYWHNRLFNPGMPGDILILGFLPDWSRARASGI